MHATITNTSKISLKKLSWLAALPISLAAYGAVTAPVKANEYHPYEHNNVRYDTKSPDYVYCSRWEYRHEYRCVSYYKPRHEEHRYEHNRHDKWDYRYNDHHESHHPKYR